MKLTQFLATAVIGAGLLSGAVMAQEIRREVAPPPVPAPPPQRQDDSQADIRRDSAERMEAEIARLRAQAQEMQHQAENLRMRARAEAATDKAMMGGGFGGGGGGRMVGVSHAGVPFQEQVERMRSWLDTVERYARLTRNPSDTAVAAVITTSDLLRSRGPQGAIEFFNKILPQVKNEAVRRTIQLQLAELYKATGQQEGALEQLQALILSVPPMPPAPPMPAMPGMMQHAPEMPPTPPHQQ